MMPHRVPLFPRLTPDSSRLTEVLIHTGQHYDDDMSAIFFRELEIPEPKYNLGIGGHDAASCPPIPVLSDPDIQAVVISAPAAQHHALATQALDAGKHCFVEKPLSLTYDEGAALVRLAEAKKKILFVGHILQYHPAVVRLKELINKGRPLKIYPYRHPGESRGPEHLEITGFRFSPE